MRFPEPTAAPEQDYVEVNANGTVAVTASGPAGLPAKPQWAADAAAKSEEKEADKGKEAASLVGSNKSIVANRMAIRMANLSAADMLKAELAAGSSSSDAKTETPAAEEDDAEVKKEKEAEEAGKAEAERNSAAAAKLKAEMLASSEDQMADEATSPRGTKRAAPPDDGVGSQDPDDALDPEVDEDDEEDADGVNAFLESSLLPPKPAMVAGLGIAEPPPLKMLGNNVVEQDDTVKCV